MKKLNIIFTLLILICSSQCFAEWRDAKDTKQNMSKEEIDEFFDETNEEFFIPIGRSKNGVNICAFNKLMSSVNLRFVKTKVDYNIFIYQFFKFPEGAVYLDLLDEDKFLIQSIFISRVCKDYNGTLLGEFNMAWDKFEKVKYYSLSSRG